MEGSGAIVPEDHVGVLEARRFPEDRLGGRNFLHSGALQKADRRRVAGVSDADGPDGGRVLEYKPDRFAKRLRSKSLSLRGRRDGEPEFGRRTVGRYTDADVSDEPVRLPIGDCQLHPTAARKQNCSAHLFDERESLPIRLRRPALIATDRRVASVGLERRQICWAEAPQDNSATHPRQRFSEQCFQMAPNELIQRRRSRPLERRLGMRYECKQNDIQKHRIVRGKRPMCGSRRFTSNDGIPRESCKPSHCGQRCKELPIQYRKPAFPAGDHIARYG